MVSLSETKSVLSTTTAIVPIYLDYMVGVLSLLPLFSQTWFRDLIASIHISEFGAVRFSVVTAYDVSSSFSSLVEQWIDSTV